MWGGCGATAWPREAKCSRESQLFLGNIIAKIFSEINLDITTTTTTTEEHYIIRIAGAPRRLSATVELWSSPTTSLRGWS